MAETGVPEVEVELSGETPARPGVEREWVASYWPVRSDGAPVGVGTVVFEVTERRAAERALRTQTDRYETLLTALSEVGEGMVVLEDGRCVYANPAFEQLSGYAFPELAAMESVFDLVAGEERDEARRRARLRLERDVIDATYQVQIRRRDGAARAARAGRRAARDRRPPAPAAARRRGARRDGAGPARRRSASGCSPAPR